MKPSDEKDLATIGAEIAGLMRDAGMILDQSRPAGVDSVIFTVTAHTNCPVTFHTSMFGTVPETGAKLHMQAGNYETIMEAIYATIAGGNLAS